MKTSTIYSNIGKHIPACPAAKGCLAAVLFVLMGISYAPTICQAQPPGNDAPGTEVLTRGPVHEAFAGMVNFNPEPGVVVTKAPPEVIEEMPPDVRPEGDNVTWIPGYWAWDDERNDFLWVSGTWRALPPGRAWIAGYWRQVPQGYQWTSGYWADAAARETTYLPAPPATVEAGPNIEAPSVDYGWTPGCWIWYEGRYAWSPGYWAQGQADWDWIPSHYIWTPRGYIFISGFWDYSIGRRGVLFAPVYFESGVYSRHGFFYAPTIAINLGVFDDYLFLRPRYNHYYFGDYYAASYYQGGFYAPSSFQSDRHGYDPIYSHQRWEHRQDREWEHRVEASYQDRRDHESARPPRTWAAAASRPNRESMAAPIAQLAQRKDSSMKFQSVAKAERQKLAQRGQEVQQVRDQRRTLEAKAVDTSARKPGAVFEPVKVTLPRSPIVATPVSRLRKNQAPPKMPPSPKRDLKFQPKSESPGHQPNVDRSNPPSQPRQVEPGKTFAPERSEAAPRETKQQIESQPPMNLRSRAETRTGQPPVRNESQPGEQIVAPPHESPQVQKPTATTHEPVAPVPKHNPAQSETRQSVPPSAKPEGNPPPTIREPSGQNANQPRSKEATFVQPPERQAHQVSEPPAKRQPDPNEKGAAKLLKPDTDKQGDGR